MRILLILLMLNVLLRVATMLPSESQMYPRHQRHHHGQLVRGPHARHGRAGCGQSGNYGCQSGGGGGGDCNSLLDTKSSAKEKATNIAQKAAAEAKAASDAQTDAANEAAQQVKTQLADKASQAAKAAEAAMAGKQQMVEQIQNEIKEAECLRQQEEQAVHSAQNNLNAVQASAQQARNAICALNGVMEMARQNYQCWEQVGATAQQELAEKTQHHEIAKTHIEQLLKKLGCARDDLERTKQAACKAATAAKKAQDNANRPHKRHLRRGIPAQSGHGRRFKRRHRRRQRRRNTK